ncbi:MAG: hypothetical protein RMJ15_09825 [Nitrososphaerota archaeon]|nr:hypothetical protein [Candidatus Bathyarchaeota archaeon]MDW8024012.1 hypothetical protein [Nitrososphaerota archaeon]
MKMPSRPIDADKLFGLHDDIRHVIVVDSMGEVVNIFSRAKKVWPMDIQREFSGIMATVTFGISEKVRDIAGEIEYIVVHYEKMKIIIVKSPKYFYIVSARKSLPDDMAKALTTLLKSEG